MQAFFITRIHKKTPLSFFACDIGVAISKHSWFGQRICMWGAGLRLGALCEVLWRGCFFIPNFNFSCSNYKLLALGHCHFRPLKVVLLLNWSPLRGSGGIMWNRGSGKRGSSSLQLPCDFPPFDWWGGVRRPFSSHLQVLQHSHTCAEDSMSVTPVLIHSKRGHI